MAEKPQLSFWQIWNMCFGFLGIQFGFALQTANVSRIFQTLGADMEQVPGLWIAAPLTGLLVQPVIGYFSDRTWTRFGRRRPYFLWGAIFSTAALLVMPNSPELWIAAGMLWVLDASLNISMEPFRALVGDQLAPRQRPTGYAMQSFFIGVGSVVASLLPWLLAKAGVANTAGPGQVPDTVRYAFYAGGAALLLAIVWTVVRTREYPPEVLRSFDDAQPEGVHHGDAPLPRAAGGVVWLLVGIAGIAAIWFSGWNRMLYVLAGLPLAYGLLRVLVPSMPRHWMPAVVAADLHAMPTVMKQLAVVQFFSWFGLFCMWLYATAAITRHHYGTTDTTSALWNEGANWVGVLFAAYNGFAALAAIAIPWMTRRLGLRGSHLVNLWLGGLGLLSVAFVRDPQWLLLSMVGIGFAWASILSLPYAMLSDSLPASKMGIYMGIFNFFIVIPQLVAVSILGVLLSRAFDGEPIRVLMLGGACFVVAGACALLVRRPAHHRPAAAIP